MNRTNSEAKKVGIHEARLRALLQALEGVSEIKIPLNRTGQEYERVYGDTDNCDHPFIELLETVWETSDDVPYGASSYAIRGYFEDFIYRPDESTNYLIEKDKRFIKRIKCTFVHKDHPKDEIDFGRQLYFFKTGNRYWSPHIENALPAKKLRKCMTIEELFLSSFKKSRRTWIEILKRHFSPSRYRQKDLGEKIITYLQNQASDLRLQSIKERLVGLIESYIDQRNKLSNQKDGKKYLLPGYQCYRYLSDPNCVVTDSDLKAINEIGFKHAFTNKKDTIDGLRFQKISHWSDQLQELPVPRWPEGFVEYVLLANMEYESAKKTIGFQALRMSEEVGFEIFYSKKANEIDRITVADNIYELAELLADYDLDHHAFVDKLNDDGNLLKKPLSLIPPQASKLNTYNRCSYEEIIRPLIEHHFINKLCQHTDFRKESYKQFKKK